MKKNGVNKLMGLTCIGALILLFSAKDVLSAPFDMFGGKKTEELKRMLQEKEQACRAMLSEKDQEYQRLVDQSKDSQDTAQSFRDKNNTLMQAYEKLKNDQAGILEQLNRLRRDSQSCTAVKESYEQMSSENEAFLQENKILEEEREALKRNLDALKSHIQSINAENEGLGLLLAEAQEDEDVKVRRIKNQVKNELDDLKERTGVLRKEKNRFEMLHRESQKKQELFEDKNSRLERDLALMRDELDAMKKQYADIKDENRHLLHEAQEFPKRFADLARHNRKLIKETSDMHYNLGVSYIKNKEYKRAVKEFKKVLVLKPDDANASYNLGYIYAEHLVDRPIAIKYFQDYLAYAKNPKDANWVRKYILTWQTWYGQEKMK